MGSVEAMQEGSKDRYFQDVEDDIKKLVPEGIVGRVPLKGTVADIVYQYIGGVRAGMGYCGAATIAELHEKAQFIEITSAGITESHPHDVTITKECKDQPVYSCDMIEATKVSALEYSFNVKVTAKNATAKDVVIDFGDGQNAIRDLNSLPVKHTYAKAGQYTIVAKASFQVDGKTVKDITSETCKTVINTDSPTVVTTGTTSTPNAPAPQSLPSTGPAEVIIGLAGASALGLGIQQWIASRRAVEAALHHK
jgi:hypothetical protein